MGYEGGGMAGGLKRERVVVPVLKKGGTENRRS